MSFRIALNFEDGATRIIGCNPDETVLNAAYRQQVNLPMDCSDGVCGTCKCQAESGRYDQGSDYIDDALSEVEAAQGKVLTCQMVPQSDCVIAVPVPAAACKLRPTEHAGTVSRVALVSPSTIVLELALDGAIDFLPGQYVNLAIPGTGETRAYSFSSCPNSATASFLIRNVPGGWMSGWLTTTAAPGDAIRLVGPYGSFFLRPAVRPIVMLAGGTGLAPMLSMLGVLADKGCDQPICLIYGVTHDADLVALDELDALGDRLPRLTVTTTVADAGSAHANTGYVTGHLPDAALNGGDCDVYLCGPPAMVEAVREHLDRAGIAPASFYYEKFVASEAVAA